MFRIDRINTQRAHSRIVNFSYTQEEKSLHVILSSGVDFLNELQNVLMRRYALTSGSITMGNTPYEILARNKKIQIIAPDSVLLSAQNVEQNIFQDTSFYKIRRGIYQGRLQELMEQIGYRIDGKAKIYELSTEQKKMVEVLRACYMCPKLLIVRELSGILSYRSFDALLKALKLLQEKGVTVLYLTSQWEEAVKISGDVTVYAHGENYGTFSAAEVRENPSELFYLIMGGRKYLPEEMKDDQRADILRDLQINVRDRSTGYNIKKTLQMFLQYLVQEMSATSVVIYLIDRKLNGITTVAAQRDPESGKGEDDIPMLRLEFIQDVTLREEIVCNTAEEAHFAELFDRPPSIKEILLYTQHSGNNSSILLQINYDHAYVYTQRDVAQLKWIAQEMAIVVENSLLMGRSVLLRESYHRIKNNLQIIVSLLEMEKDFIHSRAGDSNFISLVDEAFNGAIDRVKGIANVHDLLTKEESENKMIDLHLIATSICGLYKQGIHSIQMDFETIHIPFSKAISVALVINELVNNSIKHSGKPSESLQITLIARDNKQKQGIEVTCMDNGVGFSPEVIAGKISENSVGTMILESIISMEFGGTMHRSNDGGARVDVFVPLRTLLPFDTRGI